MDLGYPIAYRALAPGTPVYSADGQRIGAVTHVLAAEQEDIFEGVVVGEHRFGHGHRFVEAEQIERICEGGVELKLDAEQCAALPQPSANPAVLRDDPAESASEIRHERLRRAWDRISGNY
jgi:uncharacterized protein YrrD